MKKQAPAIKVFREFPEQMQSQRNTSTNISTLEEKCNNIVELNEERRNRFF